MHPNDPKPYINKKLKARIQTLIDKIGSLLEDNDMEELGLPDCERLDEMLTDDLRGVKEQMEDYIDASK